MNSLKTKIHISNIVKVAEPCHSKFDFVDINVNDDQKLFIDPCLIDLGRDKWCKKSSETIDSYFDVFYDAYRNDDQELKEYLLEHAGEINYTKLGYGNGDNGHGHTMNGLLKTFVPLEGLVKRVDSISDVVDLPVMIKGFSEDGLSDMITNIIHKQLNDYTLKILSTYGIKANSTDTYYTWNAGKKSWFLLEEPCFKFLDKKILLTPKKIVRKNYLFSADHFLRMSILERAKNESSHIDDKGKVVYTVTKNQLVKDIDKSKKHWRYDVVHEKSIHDSTYLDDYHLTLKRHYSGMGIDDETLNIVVY